MHIIVEGPPKSGKSTMALRLSSALGAETRYGHQGRVSTGNGYLSAYIDRMEDYNPADTTQHIVCDEWHLTYPLCAPVVYTSPPGAASPTLLRYADMYLAAKGSMYVYMSANADELSARYARTNPYAMNDRHAERIPDYAEAYARYFNYQNTFLPSVTYRPGMSDKKFLEEVRSVAQKTQEHAKALSAFPLYLGPQRPDILFVEWNPASYGVMTPLDHSGSRYFFHTLMTQPDLWHSSGFVNTGMMSPEKFREMHDWLGKPRMIALGQKAGSFLADIYPKEFSSVLDPVSGRRRWAKYPDLYGKMLHRVASGDGQILAYGWTPMDEVEIAHGSAG